LKPSIDRGEGDDTQQQNATEKREMTCNSNNTKQERRGVTYGSNTAVKYGTERRGEDGVLPIGEVILSSTKPSESSVRVTSCVRRARR
jgi:hypothetical protein